MRSIKISEAAKYIQKSIQKSIIKNTKRYNLFIDHEDKWGRLDIYAEDYESKLSNLKAAISESSRVRGRFRDIDYDKLTEIVIYDKEMLRNALRLNTPTLKNIKSELMAVKKHFKNFKVTKDKIFATTDDVLLEGINLGPFEIVLNTKHLAMDVGSYDDTNMKVYVKALKPNMVYGHTHPNVSEGQYLCLGYGYDCVKSALVESRILDYFDVVNSILHTYGPENPYVEIEDWRNNQCCDCGAYYVSGSGTHTQCCDMIYCDSCSSYCYDCGCVWCYDCNTICDACESKLCRDCVGICGMCGDRFCSDCYYSKDECCENCYH